MNNSNIHSVNAIPFISYHEGNGFALSPQAEQFLTSLSDQRQLGIVSIVGKYRTGKSFFVNRVLLDQKKGGFQVGPTINPCTKGLWLWKKTIPSTSNQNMDILMIDTQGFGGMDENTNHDSRIFLFSLLLSSYFIYNSVGSIDENALNSINLILNLAKQISTKSQGRVGDDKSSFPSFLWVIRDFALMLRDKNGNPINSKQYLQNSLQEQKGNSDAVFNKNKIRKYLKQFFTQRDCQMMYRPTQKQKDLQKLDSLDNSMLRPEFVNQVNSIRSKILSTVRPKKINNNGINGNMLVNICKAYIQSINQGQTPTVESAWFYVCRSQGLKAIKDTTAFLENQVEQLLKNPVDLSQLKNLKQSLRQKAIQRFKKKSLGAEQGHSDLLQKLDKRVQQCMNELTRKTKSQWQDRYKETTDKCLGEIKQKIYNDEYEQFSDYIRDIELIKDRYDRQTLHGDEIQKWKYFNQLSQNLQRLAAQTITTKLNKNFLQQKAQIKKKLQQQQQKLQQKQKKITEQKERYRTKIQILQKQNNKLIALEDNHKSRALQYKNQYDKMYDKYRVLINQHEEINIQFQKFKRESKKVSESQVEQIRGEVAMLKSTLEKERALHQMEHKYIEEQVTRYKERTLNLETQCKKLRTNNTKLTSDNESLQSKYQEKKQEIQILTQTNASYSKKIQTLIAQNNSKNQIVSDHSQWMLEKSYLENQVSFLRNTLAQNKRLHDALLVALQQSVSNSESQSHGELVEANKNLSSALEKIQGRCKVLQQKYDRVKQFKKVMKSCLSMQCANCSKYIQTHAFSMHLEQCIGGSTISTKQKVHVDSNKQNFQIWVSKTDVKTSEDKKKPYTQYKIKVNMGDSSWNVTKRYRQFSQLQQMLINRYPSIKYPQSCSSLVDINNLMVNKQKNIMSEQRRKAVQVYLRDLSKIDEIRNSDIFRTFLQYPGSMKMQQQKKQRLFL